MEENHLHFSLNEEEYPSDPVNYELLGMCYILCMVRTSVGVPILVGVKLYVYQCPKI
jgi:hypothetical protein